MRPLNLPFRLCIFFHWQKLRLMYSSCNITYVFPTNVIYFDAQTRPTIKLIHSKAAKVYIDEPVRGQNIAMSNSKL